MNKTGCIVWIVILVTFCTVGCFGGGTDSDPMANAGLDQDVTRGATVTLDGNGSSDAETYSWSLISRPTGSSAVLSDSTVADPSFVADIAGIYQSSLVVSDGTTDSGPDTVTINTTVTRDQSIAFLGNGPYAVGSTNFEHSDTQVEAILALDRDVGMYWTGDHSTGEQLYVTSLLANPSDAFTFNVAVPDDSTLYGAEAGNTIPYAGIIYYPTSAANARSDYALPGGDTLPKMQGPGEDPIFAASTAKYPLIVNSHGKWSYPLDPFNADLVEKIASYGSIVVSLFHGDRRFPDFGVDLDLREAQEFALRPLAVKTVLDVLETDPDFSQHIDFDKIGGVGNSYGGATLLASMGGRIIGPTFAGTRETTIDTRIKAAVGIVPYIGEPLFGLQNVGVPDVSTPYLAIAGESDTVAPLSNTKDALREMQGVKYLVGIEGEEHAFSENARQDAATWAIKFLQSYVEGNTATLLELQTVQSVEGGAVDQFVSLA